MVPLIAYASRQSARPGETVGIKVSSACSRPYHADFVRLLSADPNPQGPGLRYEAVPAGFAGAYPSRVQAIESGSCCDIRLRQALPGQGWTFSIRVQPWLLDDAWQAIAAMSGEAELAVLANARETAIVFGSGQRLALPAMEVLRWYEIRLQIDDGSAVFGLIPIDPKRGEASFASAQMIDRGTFGRVMLAATFAADGQRIGHFNGRLEDPAFLRPARLDARPLDLESRTEAEILHWWDFSLDIPTATVRDRGAGRCDGILVNLPTRGVCGSRWRGTEMAWRHAPREYASIHFHEDDLYDCNWETDFTVALPVDTPSGIYAIRLRCEDAEELLPLYVLPAHGAPAAPIALLMPTLTYQAYGNFDRANFDEAYRARRAQWHAYPHHPAEHREYGLSTYDRHRDGSGVCYASLHRPILTDRPGYLAYVDNRGSGLRHLCADMHIVDWLIAQGLPFDVLTDHTLHAEGQALLDRYPCVLTGTHPEYHTTATLDAIRGYLDSGGSLVYLGGNGFYWKVALSTALPGVLEVRRAEGGTRAWASDPGEYYHALDGGYGGLWRRNRRPPQGLVGVGMTAQGFFEGTCYRRRPASYHPRLAWMFEGIDDDQLGDFGLSGGGAAGFELDRADVALGTPAHAIVVASSEDHPAHFGVTPEEVLSTLPHIGGGGSADLIRADMTYFETGSGGAVFSVGSITFCGSLFHNGYKNNIATLLANVARRFSMPRQRRGQTADREDGG
ncbi:N,N-dimethylformamidase beta subunit-like C-terminal domain-containing protein [Cupriavidus oxalaticus]